VEVLMPTNKKLCDSTAVSAFFYHLPPSYLAVLFPLNIRLASQMLDIKQIASQDIEHT